MPGPLGSLNMPGEAPDKLADSGYVAYVFFCLFAMLLFVHGLSTFCAGLTSPKSSLSQLSYSLVVSCLAMVLFYLYGYSLETSMSSDNWKWAKLVGDFRYAFLRNVDFNDINQLGELSLLYGFSAVPACLMATAACQRGRFVPLLVFIGASMTLVYYPAAHWCWNPAGWINRMGALDYAGGTIIHVTSGFAALVYSLVLGPRLSYLSTKNNEQPYSLTMVVTGTVQMLIGWIGFTGGSQIKEPVESLLSVLNTMLSAAMGGFSWMILDHVVAQHYKSEQNSAPEVPFSLISFCSGVISGLVAITPGAGYVRPGAAIIFGIGGGIGCNLATKLKFFLGVDDPLDTFAVHGMGGLIGTLMTGVFAVEKYRVKWQFFVQVISGVTVAMYTLGCALMIVVVIDSIPWLSIKVSSDQETHGIDFAEHRESAAFGAITYGRNWYVSRPGDNNNVDLSQLRQANANSSMYPGSFGQPLLQQLPLSYGTYSRRQPQFDETANAN